MRELHGLGPAEALGCVLEHARRASGAERAFLLEQVPDGTSPPRVLAAASVRDETCPSLTAASRALAGRGTGAFDLDLAGVDAASVRGLHLRALLAVRVPSRLGHRRALVLDSRRPLDPSAPPPLAVIEAFASLLALLPEAPAAQSDVLETAWEAAGPALRSLLERVRAVGPSTLPVLVVGESGSGKERVARCLHHASPRKDGPFVAVNCAAIPESLLEVELFGAERGAYTGAERARAGLVAAAHGGTLFLDEVGDMPLAMQAKLLRVLQERRVRAVGAALERPVDVRVVAATHRDLRALAATGAFRPDLLYRLAVVELRVPPLRERLDDLPALASALLARLAAEAAVPAAEPTPAVLRVLASHPWPGNVRELEAALARAALRAGGGPLRPEHLDLDPAPPPAAGPGDPFPALPDEPLERAMVRRAVADAGGCLARAAARIGWTRQKLYRRLGALGLGGGKGQGSTGSDDGTTSSDSSTFQ